MERKEYIESELSKWKERYEVGFEQEFDLKLMIDLQYQLMITPMEHIKTIGDMVHTKNQIMKNLSLKPKLKPSTYKYDILLKVEDSILRRELNELFNMIIPKESLVAIKSSYSGSVFETSKYKISTVSGDTRGMRSDHMYEIKGISNK